MGRDVSEDIDVSIFRPVQEKLFSLSWITLKREAVGTSKSSANVYEFIWRLEDFDNNLYTYKCESKFIFSHNLDTIL
jgi:hypothetical protein